MTHIEQMIQDMCPHGVEFKYLTDVANVLYGYPFEAEKFSEDESNIPLIRIRDVVPAKASTYYTGTYPKEYIIKAGDILVGMDGNFNLEKWKDRNGLLNQRVCKIYSKNSDAVLDNFLYHLLKPLFKKIEDEIKGGTVKHLSAARIKQIEIPIPPLEIQKKIVECLDKFSALAAELQAELQMRRKQYEYYRTRLLTPHSEGNSATKSDDRNWEWKTLGEICDIKGRIGFRGYTRADQVEKGEGAISLSPANIKNSTITYDDCTYITWEKYEESPEIMVEEGDVIFCKTASVGKTAFIQNLPEKATINPQLVLLKNIKCNNKYLSYYLQTDAVQNAVKQYQGVGSVPNVSQAKLSEVKIALPSLDEQARIVAILDKFEALTTSLSDGIPAEQAAQQKRYEYYRDLLLTFDRKEV